MIYHFGECTFDTSLYSVQRGGQSIRLRPKVFRMCLYLLEHRDRVVSREELCSHVWPGRFVSQATVEGVIRLVRQALGDNGRAQGIILTLHGFGYRFVAEVEEHSGGSASEASPRSSPVPFAAEGPELSRSDGDRAVLVAGQEVEATTALQDPLEHGLGMSSRNEPDADGRMLIVRMRRLLARWRSPAKWQVMPRGLRLGIVALALLVGWGMWWGLSEHIVVSLDKTRIAVLPFIDLSAEANQAYFADGMTEELIAQLGQIHGLTVIARTSVMKYKGTVKDVASIGRELRVGTILQGTVRRVDNHMRINAELIDVASQSHLWSQEYDREVTGVFRLQTDFATTMAERLKTQLAAGDKRRAELKVPTGLPAF